MIYRAGHDKGTVQDAEGDPVDCFQLDTDTNTIRRVVPRSEEERGVYAMLTPEQKAILDRPMMGGHHHRGRG